MSETDVLKMKVADLKRELKVRGLSVNGNKTELQERLQSALIDGDLSLEDTAISEDVLLDDEVLTDEETPISPLPEESSNKQITDDKNKDSLVSSTTNSSENKSTNPEVDTQPKKPVVLKRKSITLSTSESINETENKEKVSDEPPEKKSNDDVIEIDDKSNDNHDGKRIIKINQLSYKERMEMRAKKFGSTNNSAGPGTLDAIISNRKINNTSTTTAVNDPKVLEALKKRAERFGVITAPQISAIDNAEKLKKRQERFGGGAISNKTDSSDSTKTGGKESVDYAEKARQRLERFKTATAN